MEPKDLQLIVEIRCKPGAEREIEQRVVEFVGRTRAEPGCSWASFHRVEEDPERFVFLAEFVDEHALQQHFDADWREDGFLRGSIQAERSCRAARYDSIG